MTDTQNLYQYFLKAEARVYTDTRKIDRNKPGLFFALSGDNFNGNHFAAAAIEQGCPYAVIDDPAYVNGPQTLLVSDCLKSLQALASHHRQQMKAEIIAITGSNGKTTTKELLYAVLTQAHHVVATQGNYNNHIGVPLTLLRIKQIHDYAIVELGTNSHGEIRFLSEMSDPDYGLITSIGKAHLEGLGSVEGVAKEKLSLFSYLIAKKAPVFHQESNPWIRSYFADRKYNDRIVFDINHGPNFSINIRELFPAIKATVNSEGKRYTIHSELFGQYNLLNIVAAVSIGCYFRVSMENCLKAINSLKLSNNRTEKLNWKGATIFLDAYNANPSSVKEAVTAFAKTELKHKWLILGDMYELGSEEIKEHQAIINLVTQSSWTQVVFIGEIYLQAKIPDSYLKFRDFADCYEWFQEISVLGAHILIKASRGMALERLLL